MSSDNENPPPPPFQEEDVVMEDVHIDDSSLPVDVPMETETSSYHTVENSEGTHSNSNSNPNLIADSNNNNIYHNNMMNNMGPPPNVNVNPIDMEEDAKTTIEMLRGDDITERVAAANRLDAVAMALGHRRAREVRACVSPLYPFIYMYIFL